MIALRTFFTTAALLGAAAVASAQETLVIRGGTVHPVSGPSFVGSVVIQGGRIAAVGPDVNAPPGARVIDATGLHVYPGLFDAGTQLGLIEVESIDVTADIDELGDFTPHLQARTAVHPASEHIPVARANGITHTLALPGGRSASGGFAGQGSVFNLAGWTIEEMEITPSAVMVMNWPARGGGGGGGFGRGGGQQQRSAREIREEHERAVHQLREWLARARDYDRAVAGGAVIPRDLRLEALARVAKGELPVFVRVDRERDIRDVIAFAEQEGLKLIIGGAGEGYKVAKLLAEKQIPVILGPTQALPRSPDARYDEAYANPGLLHAAGVKIAFATFNSADSRTLPYEAAMATGYGLPRDVALRAVTLNPAEILGLGDRLGSIEPGKIANLIVTDGDPLEITTQIRHLIIGGRETSTDNKHRQLYEKYRARPLPAARAGT